MKNSFFKLVEYLYYFSLVALFVIYLFPGSLFGYFLYGDFERQPSLVNNPIGTSINHLFFFSYLSILALICNLKKITIYNNFSFILLISILLETTHLIIPNRAFEIYDLLANLIGVTIIFFVSKIIKL
jgi:VanZ family protein